MCLVSLDSGDIDCLLVLFGWALLLRRNWYVFLGNLRFRNRSLPIIVHTPLVFSHLGFFLFLSLWKIKVRSSLMFRSWPGILKFAGFHEFLHLDAQVCDDYILYCLPEIQRAPISHKPWEWQCCHLRNSEIFVWIITCIIQSCMSFLMVLNISEISFKVGHCYRKPNWCASLWI